MALQEKMENTNIFYVCQCLSFHDLDCVYQLPSLLSAQTDDAFWPERAAIGRPDTRLMVAPGI